MGKLIMSVMDITAAMAAKMMEGNVNNRPRNQRLVIEYAAVMKAGRWQLNGETIIISDTGRVLNGQHRLAAVILSGVTVRFVVIQGVEDSAFSTMDSGSVRRGHHVLQCVQAKNAVVLASIVNLYLRWSETGGRSVTHSNVSNPETLQCYLRYKDALDKVCQNTGRMRFLVQQSTIGFLMFVTRNFHGADAFFNGLETGADLRANSPIRLLRERLTKIKHKKGTRMRQGLLLALCIKGWNAFAQGRTVSQLSFSPSVEDFPLIDLKGEDTY